MAAFGLFGGHAADPSGVMKLTTAAANGDAAAHKALVALQNTGKDPALASRLNVWWRQLSPTAHQRLTSRFPQLIGSLNGLPSLIRDQGNRRYLADQKSSISAELTRLRAQSPEEAEEAIKELELRMRQIASVEMGLSLGGQNSRAHAYLLQLELGGLGKTAISFGNPDDADNIVAYVPGTGTKLDGFGDGDARRVATMWDQANSFAKSGTKVASIAWLGYAAPQWGSAGPKHTPATLEDAEAGAPALAAFAVGLHAAHQAATDARFTVLGHSYGSTVTGLAARLRPKSFADQLIFVGSPGVGALRAEAGCGFGMGG
ncbi:alpha/beta hydrolase [Sphaerisporangium aureirubrum]|uniref:Alpha/beta hydrolase n=1 Tax=Sphaerisporangium aureirubrum TaxID=1544736 RepID=A0ABW1NC21_9ACTN